MGVSLVLVRMTSSGPSMADFGLVVVGARSEISYQVTMATYIFFVVFLVACRYMYVTDSISYVSPSYHTRDGF